jgi:hypothetical protein
MEYAKAIFIIDLVNGGIHHNLDDNFRLREIIQLRDSLNSLIKIAKGCGECPENKDCKFYDRKEYDRYYNDENIKKC